MLQLRQKKPYHIYKTETAQDKKLAQAEIDRWNEENKADCQTKWELATVMQRTHLTRNLGGQKPEWKWDKKHGKLVRDGKGGIDWYRYQNEVLRPKLLPFAIDCKKKTTKHHSDRRRCCSTFPSLPTNRLFSFRH